MRCVPLRVLAGLRNATGSVRERMKNGPASLVDSERSLDPRIAWRALHWTRLLSVCMLLSNTHRRWQNASFLDRDVEVLARRFTRGRRTIPTEGHRERILR
jgi:hypothetical protein